MEKMLSISKYAFLLVALMIVGSAVSTSAQAKKQQEVEKRFADFEIKAEGWADVFKDSNGKEALKNCKIKVHVKNTSAEPIRDWSFEGKLSRHTGLNHNDARFEDVKKPGNRLSNGSSTEIVFDTYCYMLKDSIKVYKK